jgi:hypothetical protein
VSDELNRALFTVTAASSGTAQDSGKNSNQSLASTGLDVSLTGTMAALLLLLGGVFVAIRKTRMRLR